MISIKNNSDLFNLTEVFTDHMSCAENKITEDLLEWDFFTVNYTVQAYTSGCYFFNKETDTWDGDGITVRKGATTVALPVSEF